MIPPGNAQGNGSTRPANARGTILGEILRHKESEVSQAKVRTGLSQVARLAREAPPPRDFPGALRRRRWEGCVALIAEIKKASPSKGVIRADLDPAQCARIYEASGAAALSVLTDERFFQGSPEFLKRARESAGLPVLRKDFIIDDYQVYEARAMGADAILLITAALDDERLNRFLILARELGMESLVEVHTEGEMRRVLATPARLIGINNRDLSTFKTDLATTERLAALARRPGGHPGAIDRLLVSESGINARADVERLAACGIDAILVGEALVREKDVAAKVRELAGRPPIGDAAARAPLG